MKPTLLTGALGLLLVGMAPVASLAQAKAPLTQPNSEAAANVPAGELALGTVKVPKGVKADGKPLAPGTCGGVSADESVTALASRTLRGLRVRVPAFFEIVFECQQGKPNQNRHADHVRQLAHAHRQGAA